MLTLPLLFFRFDLNINEVPWQHLHNRDNLLAATSSEPVDRALKQSLHLGSGHSKKTRPGAEDEESFDEVCKFPAPKVHLVLAEMPVLGSHVTELCPL